MATRYLQILRQLRPGAHYQDYLLRQVIQFPVCLPRTACIFIGTHFEPLLWTVRGSLQ